MSSLGDGTLTFSVTLTSGSTTIGPVTTTAILDQTPPSGYTITADQATLNATTAANAGFMLGNAEVGDAYSYTISSSAGGTAVTGSGTVNTATQDITGINLSSLPAGTLTYSVTLTDAAGNSGTAVTTTVTLT